MRNDPTAPSFDKTRQHASCPMAFEGHRLLKKKLLSTPPQISGTASVPRRRLPRPSRQARQSAQNNQAHPQMCLACSAYLWACLASTGTPSKSKRTGQLCGASIINEGICNLKCCSLRLNLCRKKKETVRKRVNDVDQYGGFERTIDSGVFVDIASPSYTSDR